MRFREVDESLAVASMICQHGYGPSHKPRIRYSAMKACLEQLADIASRREASVHMPRIGCGQAGGSWTLVSELIEEALCNRGVPVTVYDPPAPDHKSAPMQKDLFHA